MTKPLAKRGARPLNANPDLVRTLVKSLLKVSIDKRFTIDKLKGTTVLRKVFDDDKVGFEKLCMKAISSNKNENENVNDLELAMIKVPAACDLGHQNGPINHFKETILPKMITGKGDFSLNNDDEKAAILEVLELEIKDETIIDLKTNAPLKTAAEKLREREQQPEKKDKRRAYNQREDVKEKRRAYDQVYNQKEEVKEKKRAYNQVYLQKEDVKEKRRAYDQVYNQREDVKEKRRARRQERIRLSLKEQMRIPPPDGSIGGKCTICARTRSVGWKSALRFCSQIEKYFENEGFPEPQGADKTRRFLNREKTRKGGVSSEIDLTDVMCLNCVRKYERSAKMRLDIIRLSAVAEVSVAN